MKHRAIFCFLAAIIVLLGIGPATKAYATTVTRDDLGIQINFPSGYIVSSKTTIISGHDVPREGREEMYAFVASSQSEYMAVSEGLTDYFTIQAIPNPGSPTFTFLTDAEMKKLGQGVLDGFEKDGRFQAVEGPLFFEHPQTKFLSFKAAYQGAPSVQYLTMYNNKTYRVSFYGDVSDTKAQESVINSIKFLEEPIKPKAKTSVWESALVKGGAGAIAGAIGSIGYLGAKKKKKETNQQ